MKKVFIVYDTSNFDNEMIEFGIILKNGEIEKDLKERINNITNDYFDKINADENFNKKFSKVEYVANELKRLGYQFICISGEFNLDF